MYPANLFLLFPPFPREDKVFVAMSFDQRFEKRWIDVITPGVSNVLRNEHKLDPLRVDARKVSDSILTEILTGIANSRFVIADITTIGYLDGKPIRNGNVMYEVGIAQAVRLPEEVILFRSDDDPLLFDTSNIRINKYKPDENPDQARREVTEAIITAAREVNLARHLAVKKAAESLDLPSSLLLLESLKEDIVHPEMKNMGQILGNSSRASAIARLLELGALKTSYLKANPEMFLAETSPEKPPIMKYQCTEFGRAVVREQGKQMGVDSPDLRPFFEADLGNKATKKPSAT